MPTYEYKREDGTIFEYWQGINDEPLEECPETGQKVKRIISGGGGVVYKGDGFYVTDYKQQGGGKQSTNGSESTTSSNANTDNSNSDNSSDQSNE